ncbi:HAMP domain-containing sensor histidine kinase [Actinomadura luteofluorescens]|uniref:sensor histidine kinase n=1 Tax=Actinomadura luteofluorescens TaxID=46163 RepID=UPI0021646EE8|nr:HAMP domain-containing sensor histidine kinase [Actinomadura glauciflava]MCR3740618.1 Signal transduction histidine kinase [Actinomadura glauciflava]
MLRHPEIRFRVTVTASLIAFVLSSALSAVLLVQLRQDSYQNLVAQLARDNRRTATAIETGQLTLDISPTTESLQQVVDRQGRVLAATPRMQGRARVPFPPPPAFEERRVGRVCGVDAPGARCFVIVERRVGFGPDALFIYSLAPVQGPLPRPALGALIMLSVPFLTVLAGYGTWLSVSRALRPVEGIRRNLEEITATDLERRVPEPYRRDEVGRLAESVNATLDRLEEAVARQRAFVSDVSHELRSPLTALRMELELALSAPEDTDVPATLRALLVNTERLSAVVDDLLALARLDADSTFPRERVDLTEIIDQEVLNRPRRAQVTVLAEGPVTVRGGRSELSRLLTNLIDNADRHAASEVTVILRPEPPSTAVVEVIDDGTGVAPEDRERVFERFARLAEGRHRDAGGTGLGLAISRDIAEAHRGSLILTDRIDGVPGARFVLRLPRDDSPG